MSEQVGDAVAVQISTTKRVAELEVEVARLTAQLSESRGGDPTEGASRFLTMAATTVDQAIADVSREAEEAVSRAEQALAQRRAEAEQALQAARAEAEAARAAAAQVTRGAKLELEKARTSAMAMAENAATAAEETNRSARAEADQIVALARNEASMAMVSERQRFMREVDALTGVREALIKERQALEQYHDELQSRVQELAQAMVSFMTNSTDEGALESLVELTRPEIAAPPVATTDLPSDPAEEPTADDRVIATGPTVGEDHSSLVDADQAPPAEVSEAPSIEEHPPSLTVVQDDDVDGPAPDQGSPAAEPESFVAPAAQPSDPPESDLVTDEGYPNEAYEASFTATARPPEAATDTEASAESAAGVSTEVAAESAAGVSTEFVAESAAGVSTEFVAESAAGVSTEFAGESAAGVSTEFAGESVPVSTEFAGESAAGVSTEFAGESAAGVSTEVAGESVPVSTEVAAESAAESAAEVMTEVAAGGVAPPDDDRRPEDLFSDSFGFGPEESHHIEPMAAEDRANGEFGGRVTKSALPSPGPVRPVVEAIPPPPQPTSFEPVTTHRSPVVPTAPDATEEPWSDPTRSASASEEPHLFPKPDEQQVMIAERHEESELFGPARAGEGPSAEDAQFRDFIEGDDDDASRSWLLQSDET